MFFAETLGPALNNTTGIALHAHLAAKYGSRGISQNDIRKSVAEYLKKTKFNTSPEAVINLLTGMRLLRHDGRNYHLNAAENRNRRS